MAMAASVACSGCIGEPTARSFELVDTRLEAEREVEQARLQAGERYRRAIEQVMQARQQARRAAAQGEREIALAQARVSFARNLRQCEPHDGELRRACMTQAQSRYAHARLAAHRIDYRLID